MPIKFYRLRGALAAAFLGLAPLAACTAQVGEQNLLRPVPSGPLSQEAVTAAAPAYTITRHAIVAADGVRLHAVHLRQPGARATIIYFGGNGYTIGRFGAMTAAAFAPLRVDLMIVDHRGYGLSEGQPTIASIESDGLMAFDYLAALPGADRSGIYVHGHSLGSFIAGHIAANRSTAGAVLEGSVTTAEDWLRSLARRAGGGLVRVRLDESLRGRGNLANMPRIDEPLLLLVGSDDRTTPPALSEALYRASPLPPGRKFLSVIAGAGHDGLLLTPAARAAYEHFLTATGTRD